MTEKPPGAGLHIPPVLTTNFVKRIGDLAKRTAFDRLHELGEKIAFANGYRFQLFQQDRAPARIPFPECQQVPDLLVLFGR